jgi:HlyD family secretion protein
MNGRKRIAIIVVAGVVLLAAVLIAAGVFRRDESSTGYLGYIEGETSLIGPPIAGRLIERKVERGAQVHAGDLLFTIDPGLAQSEVVRAEAAVTEAEARYANLLTGKRKQEQAIVRAQESDVAAQLAFAEKELARQTELYQTKVAPKQALDEAEATVRQLRARQAALVAQENVGTLAARPEEIKAASALVQQTKANLEQSRKRLEDLMPRAPEDGMIENTFYDAGEWVTAGAPIVSLLAPDRSKLRFFIPETDLAKARIGATVRFTCDACAKDLTATINYVSPRAEYTPPIIYSQSARTKLAFMVEAKLAPGTSLVPGIPVTVRPLSR